MALAATPVYQHNGISDDPQGHHAKINTSTTYSSIFKVLINKEQSADLTFGNQDSGRDGPWQNDRADDGYS
jgi:hypothetical protein